VTHTFYRCVQGGGGGPSTDSTIFDFGLKIHSLKFKGIWARFRRGGGWVVKGLVNFSVTGSTTS
jgi:hypothetical protein